MLFVMNDGRSALYLAAANGHEVTVRLLVEAGGEDPLLVTETNGNTALRYAADKGHVEAVRIAAGGQRPLFLTNKIGFSPLHAVAADGHVDVSRLLVERGGKRLLAAKTIMGETAEDVATRCGHGALAGMLRRARVAKAGSGVWGQAKHCVSVEEEALAAERADAAMAALLAEEARPGSAGGMAARGRKGKSGSGKKK